MVRTDQREKIRPQNHPFATFLREACMDELINDGDHGRTYATEAVQIGSNAEVPVHTAGQTRELSGQSTSTRDGGWQAKRDTVSGNAAEPR